MNPHRSVDIRNLGSLLRRGNSSTSQHLPENQSPAAPHPLNSAHRTARRSIALEISYFYPHHTHGTELKRETHTNYCERCRCCCCLPYILPLHFFRALSTFAPQRFPFLCCWFNRGTLRGSLLNYTPSIWSFTALHWFASAAHFDQILHKRSISAQILCCIAHFDGHTFIHSAFTDSSCCFSTPSHQHQ